MLSTLRIGNFKAFAENQIIPLSPITLIFGPNSAGKSSILHSLLLYHHAAQTGDVDVRHTRLGGETVDLGGFERYVHGRDPDSTVSFRIESELQSVSVTETKGLNSEVEHRMLKKLLGQGEKISLVLEVEQEREESEVGTYSVTTPPHIKAFEIEVDGELVLRADRKGNGRYSISRLVVENRSINSMLEGVAGDTDHSEHWKEEKRWLNSQVQFEGGNLGPSVDPSVRFRRAEDRLQQQQWRITAAQNESNDSQEVSSETSFAKQVLLESARVVCQVAADHFQEEAARFRYLAPLRSYPSRRLLRQEGERPGEDWEASGGRAWEVLRDRPRVREKVNEWLGEDFLETNYRLETDQHYSSRRLGSELTEYLVETVVLILSSHFLDEEDEAISSRLSKLRDGLRGAAAGATGAAGLGAGAALAGGLGAVPAIGAIVGGVLTGYREVQTETEEELPDWTKELKDADSEEEIRQAVTGVFESEGIVEAWLRQLEEDVPPSSRELTLIDERTETRVSHRDIGIGISQVLPVLVHAQAAQEETVLMEQPELHLHPRLQTRLGDILIESMHRRGNQFILETHSEHLILRLMRRIRETSSGTLPSEKEPLNPNDVSVIFVDSGDDGPSIVRRLQLDSQGELIDGWPRSFFDEGFEERFGL
jgi:predicted ATPase